MEREVDQGGEMLNSFVRRIFALFAISAAMLTSPNLANAGDTRAHCASVRNDDTVRTIPPSLVAGAANLFHEAVSEAASHREMYVYRCMGGSVWVCNHGANIPCTKGDTRRTLPSVTAYCKENPKQDFVPMAVSGHSTIHSFACIGGQARITQSQKVDGRGFIADQWERLR
jgi:hypothetical protein